MSKNKIYPYDVLTKMAILLLEGKADKANNLLDMIIKKETDKCIRHAEREAAIKGADIVFQMGAGLIEWDDVIEEIKETYPESEGEEK